MAARAPFPRTAAITRTARAVGCGLLLLLLGGCATVDTDCQEQLDQCMRRCRASDPETGPALSAASYEDIMSECERRCRCRDTKAPDPPPGKPTFTN